LQLALKAYKEHLQPVSTGHQGPFAEWWRVKDSNLGRHQPTDLRSFELGHLEVAEFIDHGVREAG
jgi:hypothetical protein